MRSYIRVDQMEESNKKKAAIATTLRTNAD